MFCRWGDIFPVCFIEVLAIVQSVGSQLVVMSIQINLIPKLKCMIAFKTTKYSVIVDVARSCCIIVRIYIYPIYMRNSILHILNITLTFH